MAKRVAGLKHRASGAIRVAIRIVATPFAGQYGATS
jgi:hypothetical protein